MNREVSIQQVQRMLVQQLESLERAGLTHLRKVQRSLSLGDVSSGGGSEQPATSEEPIPQAGISDCRSHDRGSKGSPPPSEDRRGALEALSAEVARCRRCPELVAHRTQTVFGTGDPYARLVFIGEAPGVDEDRLGEPFVGAAGQLLTDMIEKGMGLERSEVYIMNILKCRPPGNRTPLPEEAQHCRPFLQRQLSLIRPKFLCCLGACAAQNLLGTTETIGRLRGKTHSYQGIPVVCTYHPAYLLRTPKAKRQAWEDLKLLMSIMGLPMPGASRSTKRQVPGE